jgi:hypothetical protein
MNNSFTSQKPLSYENWLNTIGYNGDISQDAYFVYLTSWYNLNKKIYLSGNVEENTKEQYIQLIKDLTFLFSDEEKNLFLTDINFDNEEDLIYVIPYIANKLKQISQIISQKREELKKTKVKDQLIGSEQGLEKILYEYILKNFTNKPYHWTKIPMSSLTNQFPQLSSISEDFFIEIEELYDTNSYYDSDPTVNISEYFDINDLISKEPYSSLSDEELGAIVTSRLLERVADTPLSKVFNEYLTITSQLSTEATRGISDNYTESIYNQIAASQKYLGETIYSLTAIRDNQINNADFVLNLPFERGNNWFYWPSGDKGPDPLIVGNVYTPISINQSNLVLNRTVSGSDYLNADLFFAEKNGILEGAWLQGYRERTTYDNMSIKLKAYDKTEFIFPWVGFEINSKDLSFKDYILNDSNINTYQKLDLKLRSKILNAYFSSTLPNSASYDMYLNQTKLIDLGANAGFLSDEADTILVTPSSNSVIVWNDTTQGMIQQAFLYKFLKTDIYIKNGLNDIHWPIQSFEGGVDSVTLTLSSDTCIPILLGATDPSKTMVGAVAGNTFDESDIIYKLLDNGGLSNEAAWLGSGSISLLDPVRNAIPIYDIPAVNCAQYIEGPIQPSLYMKMEPGKYNTFLWMDQDTPADDVFYYQKHSSTCPFGNSFPHNFYVNQDYQNPKPLNDGKQFPLNQYPCTCQGVNYSPIGTEGNFPTDYNSMGDLLFADPQGLGEDFTHTAWRDTRNLNPSNSPQFSFYKIDGKLDKDVGFGKGNWTTPTGQKMILKTGRRYTYYRSNFRINSKSTSVTPYLFAKYAYKNISVTCGPNFSNPVDLVILIDNSRTQYFNIEIVKNMAKTICEKALDSNKDVQISIISFSERGLLLNYLSNDLNSLLIAIEKIKVPEKYPNWLTNITEGLILANNVLFTNQPPTNDCNFGDVSKLCSGLQSQIINQSKLATVTNCPRSNAIKQILIFSDGQETVNVGTAEIYANAIKKNNVSIYSTDIGYYALKNNLMENIASPNLFFNLQEYLLYSDVNIDTFTLNLVTLLMGCFPSIPIWCKAYKDENGAWIGLNIPSDMVLNPGDFFAYVHKSYINYASQNNFSSFRIPSLSFTINIKLDGWDYYTHTFKLSSRGEGYGAKPFWGKVYTQSTSAIPYGGGGRTMDEYVILHQPEVSDIILKNGNYITYYNKGKSVIPWSENLTFKCTYTDQKWNKLEITKQDSNLASKLDTINKTDYIINQTNEPSDIALESYSTLNPTKYTFYLAPFHTPFTYTENLYYIDRCYSSFVVFTSGEAVKAVQPYLNLDNIHYPTIANITFPSTYITEKETGTYLLPNKLGVSYYRGVGYEMALDPKSISYLDSLSAEYMFLDINKYGPRNRGLTKKDQVSPVEIKRIDNTWMIEPYSSGLYKGTIINTVKNQKLIPYQSNYEINPNNQIGLSLQRDNLNFWNPNYYDEWTDKKNYPVTLRDELIINNFVKKTDTFLTDVGIQSVWKSDIYGNNFGLFKGYGMETSDYILTENNDFTMTTEYGLRFETE